MPFLDLIDLTGFPLHWLEFTPQGLAEACARGLGQPGSCCRKQSCFLRETRLLPGFFKLAFSFAWRSLNCQKMISYKSLRQLTPCRLTRLAPTPSGFLHLGNLLSFAITCHFATKTGARILLRIDDLDQERTRDAYLDDIFDALRFLQIPWHQGPVDKNDHLRNWSQHLRMKQYQQALSQLAEARLVFGCACTRNKKKKTKPSEEDADELVFDNNNCACEPLNLPLENPDIQWRLKTPPGEAISINRLGGGPLLWKLPTDMQNFVVRRKNGLPAYQLASLVDDQHFQVDLVVRGTDLWPSSWAQSWLASRLPADPVTHRQFVHHPLLLDQYGSKLSKSAGATSIQYLRKQGFSAADIFTRVATLMGSNRPCSNWSDLGLLAESTFAP